MTVFTRNLKRLRLAKGLTQEQAARALGVSAQAVSRWECETTLPDVTLLPKIAQVYCVSIDDLYRETSVAYENQAQRLVSVYKSTWEPEDFSRADREFRKLRLSGTLTPEDLRCWGVLHQYMLGYCIKTGQVLFGEVLTRDPQEIGGVYDQVEKQKQYFMHLIGRGKTDIAQEKSHFDEARCLQAFRYEEENQWDAACEIWSELEAELGCKGFDIEAGLMRARADRCGRNKQ